MNVKAFCVFLCVLCASAVSQSLLIDPATLKAELPRVRIVDMRDSEPEYLKGHIPGAVRMSIRQLDNLEANRQGMPVPLDKAREIFAALGLDRKTPVVAYDDADNRLAARLLFFLEFFGHKNVRVLDGGLKRWVAEGGTLETTASQVKAGNAVPKIKNKHMATANWITSKQGKVVVLDSRGANEYNGRGHIPGATNLDYHEVLTSDGRFKSASELRSLMESKGVPKNRPAVTYCQTGVRAAALYVALREAGYNKARVYDGSFEDWSSDPQRPVEKDKK